jgi:hypothetical protein
MKPLTQRARLALALLPLFALSVASATAQTPKFTMNESFLRTMIERDTIQPTFRVRMTARGPLHTLADDCEMHIAGTVQDASLGTPPAMVVEFPSWCKIAPDGTEGQSFNVLSNLWRNLVDTRVINRDCDVRGFLRIFCEHCAGGGSGGSNPNHAYEFHPAMSMRCGQEDFDFSSMLRAFPGLRHIQPSTAARCIDGRELRVRFRNNRYEFAEQGGGSCGNFAIVRVEALNMDWSFAIDGGHYAFADVTANGQVVGGIGLYTLSGSDSDAWLAQRIAAGGMGNTTKTLHGVFTYDWFAIMDTLQNEDGSLRRPATWQRVDFPLALIVYGEATAPF